VKHPAKSLLDYLRQMLLNLTVVYFAFGAPLGVYGVIRSKGTSPAAMALNVVRFLLWPLFAAASVREAFVFQPPHEALEQKIDALRAEFEAEIEHGSFFEFRDIFARYTGLALAAANPEGRPPAGELLDIAGRSNTRAAAACLARRNRRRVELHLLHARTEFNTFADQTARCRELTLRLAELLDDADAWSPVR
jgi:hypothetical protein